MMTGTRKELKMTSRRKSIMKTNKMLSIKTKIDRAIIKAFSESLARHDSVRRCKLPDKSLFHPLERKAD